MKKMELLSPAGSFEALEAAITNGADAIYLGGKKFGARAFANNFDDEEIVKAINYAHLYGVKIYVTLNTTIYDDEVQSFIDYALFLRKNGVDAVILQDLGMVDLLRKILPDLEIHASTQMHVHNLRGVKLLEDMGVKRIVLARELSLDQIKKIKEQTKVELEVFGHGALCISYSGQCLMSSLVGGRSGNRGECAGTCRLPYELIKEENGVKKKIKTDGSYLLSTKDLNTLENLTDIIESGISSLKIEGRMKRSEYVGLITSLYRKAIDAYYEGDSFKVSEEMILEMKKIFNRGFTKGHLFKAPNEDLMNPLRPNHMGILIGKVIAINNNLMSIKLEYHLVQGDGIRILSTQDDGFIVNKLYKNGKLVNRADRGDKVELEIRSMIKVGDEVVKTSDIIQLQTLKDSYTKSHARIKVDLVLDAFINKEMTLMVDDGNNCIFVSSDYTVQEALKNSTSKEEIHKQLMKTGNTPYTARNININGDSNVFIPISAINDLRRKALDKLSKERIAFNQNVRMGTYIKEVLEFKPDKVKVKALVNTDEQYQACLKSSVNDIYIKNDQLYNKYKEHPYTHKVYPRVMNNDEHIIPNSLVGELGSLKENVITDFSFNVSNAYTVAFLHSTTNDAVSLSTELSVDQMKILLNNYKSKFNKNPNVEVIVYGKVEAIISRYCPLHMHILKKDNNTCNLCHQNCKYYLRDKFNNDYLIDNNNCLMTLYDYKQLNMIDNIKEIINIGVCNIRLNFIDEDYKQCLTVLNSIDKMINE